MEEKIYSFDIYDTCLVRTCGRSVNVIYALAYKVLGKDADFVSVRDFVRKRLEIEEKLFKEGEEAPPISQIYENFDVSYYTDISPSKIMEMEMELESSILVPVAEVVKQIEKCRKKGRVIFISDMYFSSAFLRSILKRYNIIKDDEALYVSCEHNVTKNKGGLFDVVKEKEHISFKNWTHYGDDFNNDYIVPKKKGIKVKRIKHNYNQYEGLAEDLSPYTSNKVSLSIIAGISRATRLKLGVVNDGGLLSDVMCNILIPFVGSCLQDAKNRNIKRLYFASRDGYVMYLVAKKLSLIYPDIEIRYLHISTRVIYPTLIEEGTEDEIRRLLSNILIFKLLSILKLLGFDDDDIANISRHIDVQKVCTYGDEVSEKFINLLTTKERSNLLARKGKEKKKLLLDYLKQEKFLPVDDAKVGLVDIGWRCTSQRFLSELIGNSAMYYYFGVVKENFYEDEMGPYKPSFYTDILSTSHPKLLECYICNNLEGTVLGYEQIQTGRIVVKHADSLFSQNEIDDFEQRKCILETSALMYLEYPFILENSNEVFNIFSSRILKEVLNNPSKEIVSFLADKMYWDHYVDNQRVIHKYYIYQYLMSKISYLFTHKIRQENALIWKEACICYTYGHWAIAPARAIVKRLRKIKRILK